MVADNETKKIKNETIEISQLSVEDDASLGNMLENFNEQCVITEWYDYDTNHKRVMVVFTLPSGTNPQDVNVTFDEEGESGVTDFIYVELPWNRHFMDPNKIMPEIKDPHHPMKLAYCEAWKNKFSDKHNNKLYQKMIFRLPITVQKDYKYLEIDCVAFTCFEQNNNKKIKQYVYKIKLTGVLDRFTDNKPKMNFYDSDDNNNDDKNNDGNAAEENKNETA